MSKFFRSYMRINLSTAILLSSAMISLALVFTADTNSNRSVDSWQLETKVFSATNRIELETQVALDNLQMEVDILKEANRLRNIHEAKQHIR